MRRSTPTPRSIAALGGARIHDVPPAAPDFPYVTLGEAQVSDWSTATERGEEHRLSLAAWSRQGGHAEAHAIAHLIQQALHDAPLELPGHALVESALQRGADQARAGRADLPRAAALPRRDGIELKISEAAKKRRQRIPATPESHAESDSEHEAGWADFFNPPVKAVSRLSIPMRT